MTCHIAFFEQNVRGIEAKQALAPGEAGYAKVTLAEGTYLFIVPELNGLLRVAVRGSNALAAYSSIRTITIASALASGQETLVWRVPSPVVTVFQVLKVLRYTRDFLKVSPVHNRHRGGPSLFRGLVPLFL